MHPGRSRRTHHLCAACPMPEDDESQGTSSAATTAPPSPLPLLPARPTSAHVSTRSSSAAFFPASSCCAARLACEQQHNSTYSAGYKPPGTLVPMHGMEVFMWQCGSEMPAAEWDTATPRGRTVSPRPLVGGSLTWNSSRLAARAASLRSHFASHPMKRIMAKASSVIWGCTGSTAVRS